MRAGAMKYRLKIMQAVRREDRFGAIKTTWAEVVTAHAERVQFSATRSNQNAEPFADYKESFRIRDAHKVTEQMRCQLIGCETIFSIIAIEKNLDRGFQTLICERVNE